jgi:hypothetical protein
MSKRLAELEKDRDAGKPGAQEKFKSFRVERIMEADSIAEVSLHSVVRTHLMTRQTE